MFVRRHKWKTLLILIIGLAIFIHFSGYLFVYNNDAYVNGNVIKISTRIAGTIDNIHIKDNQFVQKGELLVSIDPKPFKYQIEALKAKIVLNDDQIKLLTISQKETKENIKKAKLQLKLADKTYIRNQDLLKSGVISQQQFDQVSEKYQTSLAQLQRTKLELSYLQQQITTTHHKNKEINTELKLAQYKLSKTKIYAPKNGYINHLRVYVGDTIDINEDLFGLIEQNSLHVTANIKESNLIGFKKGQKVLLYISSMPWLLHIGIVESIGKGVARSDSPTNPSLPYVKPTTSWIQYAYRIPVQIKFDQTPKYPNLLAIGVNARVISLPWL